MAKGSSRVARLNTEQWAGVVQMGTMGHAGAVNERFRNSCRDAPAGPVLDAMAANGLHREWELLPYSVGNVMPDGRVISVDDPVQIAPDAVKAKLPVRR